MISKKEVINQFSSNHNLRIPEYLLEDADGLYTLIMVREAIGHGLKVHVSELLDKGEPTWPIAQAMLDRVYEHVEGAFISLFTGAWASVEIVCRSALEAAINVLYVLESDTINRVPQYFSNYFEESNKAIDRYEHVHCETPEDANQQKRHADHARSGLETRKKIVEDVFRLDGIPLGVNGWPKHMSERFKRTIGEFAYRGLYATLSSQVHNDADAIIDHIMLKTVGRHIDHSIEMTSKKMLC